MVENKGESGIKLEIINLVKTVKNGSKRRFTHETIRNKPMDYNKF